MSLAGIPRVRVKDGHILCGWASCGGTLALLNRLDRDGAYVRDSLQLGPDREGLTTWVVRGQARRYRSRPSVDDPLRSRQRRAMDQPVIHVANRRANYISIFDGDDAVLMECPACAPKLGRG